MAALNPSSATAAFASSALRLKGLVRAELEAVSGGTVKSTRAELEFSRFGKAKGEYGRERTESSRGAR